LEDCQKVPEDYAGQDQLEQARPLVGDLETMAQELMQVVEALAAELTSAAYPVALRHAVGDKWLDLELELWRVFTETVKKWGEIAANRRPVVQLGPDDGAKIDVISGLSAGETPVVHPATTSPGDGCGASSTIENNVARY
jgi:hypothetical protein